MRACCDQEGELQYIDCNITQTKEMLCSLAFCFNFDPKHHANCSTTVKYRSESFVDTGKGKKHDSSYHENGRGSQKADCNCKNRRSNPSNNSDKHRRLAAHHPAFLSSFRFASP